MGIIRSTYNYIMTLIGLAVIGVVVYVFLSYQWEQHREQQYTQDREQLISSSAKAAGERGLGDLVQLQQDYLALCPVNEFKVLEGDASAICPAMAEALFMQTQKRGMTLSDHGDIQYELCVLEAKQEDEDPDDYCERQYTIDEVVEEAVIDALALALCSFDRARVFEPRSEQQLSKRGSAVYSYHELRVDCTTRLFEDPYYEGFFDGLPEEDEDWPAIIESLYQTLESENNEDVIALLDSHEFGKDEQLDHWILNFFVDDRFVALLPEVLERNGGKVNYESFYYQQPLSRAIYEDSPKTALLLLEAGADPVRPYEYGVTPVVNAASKGMLDVVQELVARGADVNGVAGSESLDFGAALRWASWESHEGTALWLLENGAAIAPEDPSQYPMWPPDTLLDYAVAGGDLAVVRALLQMGAASKDSLRLIKGAVDGGNPDVLLLLFDEGYKLPEPETHERIYSAVVNVIQEEGRGRVEDGNALFEILLERGLDMSNVADSGWNYAHQAVTHYGPPTIRADNGDDRNAVIYAERLRFVKRVIDVVLAQGIDIDQRYESETMLMEAADSGQAQLVRHLLDQGADATLKNDDGRTALDVAVSNGRRLTGYWEENESLKNRFADVIEMLGGSRELLNPPEEESARQ